MAFPEQVVEMCFLCAMIHKLKTGGGGGEASLNFSTTATVEHKFNKKQLRVKHRVRKLLNNYKYEITVNK